MYHSLIFLTPSLYLPLTLSSWICIMLSDLLAFATLSPLNPGIPLCQPAPSQRGSIPQAPTEILNTPGDHSGPREDVILHSHRPWSHGACSSQNLPSSAWCWVTSGLLSSHLPWVFIKAYSFLHSLNRNICWSLATWRWYKSLSCIPAATVTLCVDYTQTFVSA